MPRKVIKPPIDERISNKKEEIIRDMLMAYGIVAQTNRYMDPYTDSVRSGKIDEASMHIGMLAKKVKRISEYMSKSGSKLIELQDLIRIEEMEKHNGKEA